MDALNRDMPYDQFVKMQLAGDILEPEKFALATGFLALEAAAQRGRRRQTQQRHCQVGNPG